MLVKDFMTKDVVTVREDQSMLEARESGGDVSPELVEAIDAVLFDHDGEDTPDTPLFEGDCSEADQEDEDSLDDTSDS